ncbi:hypothetical protein HDU76_011047, partial [Blyttiomyces sp. JEL0837]
MSVYYIAAIFIFGPVKSAGMIVVYYGRLVLSRPNICSYKNGHSIFMVQHRERTRYKIMLKTYLLEKTLSSETFCRHLWQKSDFQFHRKDIEGAFSFNENETSSTNFKLYQVESTTTFRSAETESGSKQDLPHVEGAGDNHGGESYSTPTPMSFWKLFLQDSMG